jgi:hypothetical protein
MAVDSRPPPVWRAWRTERLIERAEQGRFRPEDCAKPVICGIKKTKIGTGDREEVRTLGG